MVKPHPVLVLEVFHISLSNEFARFLNFLVDELTVV
jgi:hypothetical protein